MEGFILNAQLNAHTAEAWAEAGEEPVQVGAECLASTGGGQEAWLRKPQQQIHQVTE